MTIATFKRTGDTWSIDICGHAGYNRGGPDIVCSACSVLTCTLMQCIRELEEKGAVRGLVEAEHSGDVKLSFEATRTEPHTVVHTIMAGFFLLKQTYPEHVKYVYTNAAGKVGADASAH